VIEAQGKVMDAEAFREAPGHCEPGGLISAGHSARSRCRPQHAGDDEPAPTQMTHGGRLCRGSPVAADNGTTP
jgi:hypothetical protein